MLVTVGDALIEDLQRLLPHLAGDGYRKGRSNRPATKAAYWFRQPLTTIIESARRPGPNLGILSWPFRCCPMSWFAFRLWKRHPTSPIAWPRHGMTKDRRLAQRRLLQATGALEQAVAADENLRWHMRDSPRRGGNSNYGYREPKDELVKVYSLIPTVSRVCRK